MASPAFSHEASPSAAGGGGSSGATPALRQLRHTPAAGRSEAHRAQLLQRLGMAAPQRLQGRGELQSQSSLETADTPAASGLDALRRAAERAQLLQAMAMQQFGELETTHTAQSGPDAASEVARLRAMVQSRDEKIRTMSAELSEAHADLARDETIFAEKLQEMRKLAKAQAALQAEHDALLAGRHGVGGTSASTAATAANANANAKSKSKSGGGAEENNAAGANPIGSPSAPPAGAKTPPSAASTRSPRSERGEDEEGLEAEGEEEAGEWSPLRPMTLELAEKLEEDDNVLCGSPVASDDESDIAADGAAGRAADREAFGAAFAPHDELLLGGDAPPTPPDEEALEQSIRELEDERAALQSTADVVSQAAAESAAPREDYAQQQQRLDSSERDLAQNIKLKEELIRDLTKADEESKSVVSSYQARLREMSERIVRLQEQLQQTKQEMESAERQAGKSEEMKARLRADYERRLRETEAQLAEMRRKQRRRRRRSGAARRPSASWWNCAGR